MLERGRKFRLHLVARKRKTDVKARSAERLEHVSGKGERMTTHKLKKQYYSPATDGFYGTFYECPVYTEKAVILMLGDAVDDRMAVSGVKWLHQQECHVMAMAPDKKDYGHHNYPLERFGKAIEVLQEKGSSKIGIVGASTTGMLALAAASYYPQISLTVAISPPDFIMEGFYQDGKDGMHERPGDNESTLTWQGRPLPYLPYAYRHPEYWQKIKEESKAGKDMVASRLMFDESERRHPVQEEERIKVERIHGKVICIGAEDDVLWDTCKYIRRMEKRLEEKPHRCKFKALIYEHGTHFAFPESMLKIMLPVGGKLFVGGAFRAGREYPKECRETRIDIDRKLRYVFRRW
jgi:pimeloyl-ACP methyl ester carboxylesterase